MTPSFSRLPAVPSSAMARMMLPLARFGLLAAPLLALPLMTTGCQHRDAVDTTMDTTHALMGGEISRLHPPTPGFDRPAPQIALIPTTAPELPSEEARLIITNRLIRNRNASQRLAASGGALPVGMVNPPPPRVGNGGSMTLASQGAPSATGAPAPGGNTGGKPAMAGNPSGSGPADGSGLIYQPIAHAVPVHLPDPGQPPRPLLFAGFRLPDEVQPLLPDFDTADPAGTLIRFQPGTDHPADGQDDTLDAIVAQRHHHLLAIRGFGSTLTARTGLGPDDQAHDIALGLLRARAVAGLLARRGVPAGDMRLAGEPLGDGVRVTYEKNPNATRSASH